MTRSETPPTLNRLEALDLARFLAFAGMVVVNFSIVMGAEEGQGALAYLASALQGRAAASFVVLAGIGLGLASLKRMGQTITVTLKRALFLLVIGLLNMTVFDADILHYYAFYFLFGAMLLPLGNRALIAAILGLNLAFVIMILVLDYDLGWNWEDYSYSGFWTPAGFVRNLFFNGWHPVIPWLSFLLFGVILSRTPLAERAIQIRLIIGGALALIAAEALSGWLSTLDPTLVDLITTQPIPPMPLYVLAGIGAASLLIGICLLIAPALQRLGILQMLVPAGRQTLTLYIAHILIGMGTLEALGMIGGQSFNQAIAASMIFVLASALYAWLWAKRFPRGPVEAVMRKLAG